MFEDWSDEDKFDFKKHWHDHKEWGELEDDSAELMRDVGLGVLVALGLLAAAIAVCCCRRRRARGRVLAPPGAAVTTVVIAPAAAPAPYPRQQYVTAAAPYPAVSPYAAQPYPPAAQPYAPAGAPPPGFAAAHEAVAPSAPALYALPPTYEQATAAADRKAAPP